MNHDLKMAEYGLEKASESLRDALTQATAVEALILLPIITAVSTANNTVIVFSNARGAK